MSSAATAIVAEVPSTSTTVVERANWRMSVSWRLGSGQDLESLIRGLEFTLDKQVETRILGRFEMSQRTIEPKRGLGIEAVYGEDSRR
jgi:hypothetical protein